MGRPQEWELSGTNKSLSRAKAGRSEQRDVEQSVICTEIVIQRERKRHRERERQTERQRQIQSQRNRERQRGL